MTIKYLAFLSGCNKDPIKHLVTIDKLKDMYQFIEDKYDNPVLNIDEDGVDYSPIYYLDGLKYIKNYRLSNIKRENIK